MTEHTTHQKIALVTGANKGIGRAAAGNSLRGGNGPDRRQRPAAR